MKLSVKLHETPLLPQNRASPISGRQYTCTTQLTIADDLVNPKRVIMNVEAYIVDSIVITVVQDVFSNPVEVGDLKGDIDLMGKIVDGARNESNGSRGACKRLIYFP